MMCGTCSARPRSGLAGTDEGSDGSTVQQPAPANRAPSQRITNLRIKELLAGTALVLALSTGAYAQTAPAGCVKGATLAAAGGSEAPKLAAAGGSEAPKLAAAGGSDAPKLASAQPCG